MKKKRKNHTELPIDFGSKLYQTYLFTFLVQLDFKSTDINVPVLTLIGRLNNLFCMFFHYFHTCLNHFFIFICLLFPL